MSPNTQLFGQAAEGSVPLEANVTAAVVMHKDIGIDGAPGLAENMGKWVGDGVSRPINALVADTKATPGGGLDARGDEDIKYDNKAGGMFGFEDVPGAPGQKPVL